jgi:hypothetical protein
MNRTLQAARLHVVHPLAILGVPWLVGLSSFTVNELIWGFGHLGSQPDNAGGTGGVLALYITVSAVFLQSVTQLFPFAMGVGLSRHTFYAGTAVMALAQSLGYALVLTILSAVENASGGWWTGLHFFAPVHIGRLAVVEQFAIFFLVMLGFALLGIAIGSVQKRWGAAGLYALAVGALLLFGGAAVLVTALGSWSAIGSWFTDTSVLAIAAVYLGFAAIVSGTLSWTGLRRVVP